MTDMVTTQSSRAASTVADLAESLFSLTMMFAYLLAAFLIAPTLTAGALVVFLLVSLGMQFFVARAEKIGAILVKRDNDVQVSAIESLTGIQVLKAFRLERFRWKDLNQRSRAVGQANYRLAMTGSLMAVTQEIVIFGIIGSIVFVAVSVMDLGIPVIVPLLFSLYRLMPRFAALNAMRHSLAGSMGSVRAVAAGIDTLAGGSVVSGKKPFTRLEKQISLNAVDFSYNGSSEVLRGTSFSIEKGEMTAIVGASGAGKSTVIGLIQRFYDPTAGNLEVDGTDLKELDLEAWHRAVSIVSQDIFLFNDTIANNISLWRPGVTMERVIVAARQAYSHDFIQELPQGYDTLIGDRGWNLSGGQRQRIALARAIVEEPDILILDEATSSLDSESERLIQNYMNEIRGTCTMIVVAHRTATIRNADKIVVLQDGRIVEEGDWATLVGSDGVFANYQHLQSNG
jgi:ABC-type multidrug transport system fused ATPase/permease subunit